MDLESFGKSPAGRLVKVGKGEAAYWAFVPHPLPPDVVLTRETTLALSAADRAVGRLDGLGRELPNPHLLIRPLVRREAVSSSRIEGTQADLADLLAFEAGQRVLFPDQQPAPEADVREVHNYVVALEHGLSRREELPISLRMLQEIHTRLMQGVRGEDKTPGEFRRSPNWIGPAGCALVDATFVPPPPDEMQTALGAFEKYLHAEDDYPPLVRLALVHYQFEAIHPFLDGNGRIGRLLLALLAVHWGLVSQPLLYLSDYFERNRDRYCDLLLAVSQEGAWEDWAAFFLAAVAEQATDTISRARALLDLPARWRPRLARVGRSAKLQHLAEGLLGNPVLTVPEAAQALGLTGAGTQKIVDKLLQAEILSPVGTGRPQHYAAPEVLEVLGYLRSQAQ